MECGVFGCRPRCVPERTHMVSLLIVLCVLLRTRAQDVPCNVTQGRGWTRYSVPESDGTDCEYSWSNNGSDCGQSHVVANHQSETKPPVLERSMNLLTTQTCCERVHYKRDCISEGVPYQATCTATCNVNAEIRTDGRVNPLGPATQSRYHACIPVLAFLIPALLGLFLMIRYRKRCRSNPGPDVEGQC